MIEHIEEICGLSFERVNATIIYEYDTMYICHLKGCDLHKNDDISNQQICLCDNLGDLFTKSLPSIIFEQLIQKIGLHFLTCFIDWGGDINISCTLFPFTMILSHLVFLVKFLTRQVYGILYFFPSLGFFPYWILPSKVLTSHILNDI